MIEYRDLGLLPEAEYMIRSQGSSPYDYARKGDQYRVEQILGSAKLVGNSRQRQCVERLANSDSGVRYWAIMALMQFGQLEPSSIAALKAALVDDSPSVQINAAEALCRAGEYPEAVATLEKWLEDERPWLVLQAARSVQLIGEDARPLIPVMYKVLENNLGESGSARKYKDFNYAAFTSWALEWALQELGENIKVN